MPRSRPDPACLTGEKNGYAIGREVFVASWADVNTPLGLPGQRQANCTRTFFIPLRADLPRKQPEIHYCATSLPTHQASPERLARLIREHWLVENLVHHVKDRTFLEDRHWLKNPATAQSFTFLRTLAVDLSRHVRIPDGTGREHCPAKIEYMQTDIQRQIRIVTNKKMRTGFSWRFFSLLLSSFTCCEEFSILYRLARRAG